SCPGDGLWADPCDCQRYYHCSSGIPNHLTCGASTLWSQALQYCDWEANVECIIGSQTTAGQTTTRPQTTTTPQTATQPQATAAPLTATQPQTTTAPQTTPAPQTTTAPQTTPLPQTTAAPQTTTITQPYPTNNPACGTFTCPGDGLWADPCDCQKFYNCHAGTGYHTPCSDGTLWNDVAK
ncbi:hypothetical protein SK128_015976, partial [Halocaridina rubra]